MRLLSPRIPANVVFALCTLLLSQVLFGQPKKYTVANAHAHNDYEHPVPFYTAYDADFGSIEADVFPVNGILLVAHSKKAVRADRTLDSLYLMPLLSKTKEDPLRKVNLLIDIKENYKKSLALLINELAPLKKYLYSPSGKTNPITILISGERPSPAEYRNYPDYIFFDDDLRKPHTRDEWSRVGLVSLSFERYSNWNGTGVIPEKDWDTLKFTVDSVHHAGKKIRFWAAPDNENSWKLQIRLKADFIGTDRISGLSALLRK